MTTKQLPEKFSVLIKQYRKNGMDGFLVTNHLDQLYLTSFTFFEGESVFLVHAKGVVCFTRSLYVDSFQKAAPYVEVIGEDGDRIQKALERIKKLGLKRVGFDAGKEHYLTGKRFIQDGLVEGDSFISQLRRTKDANELKLMRASNRLTYLTYEYIKPRIKAGMRESEVAAEMEWFMRTNGASALAFSTIVAFGENTSNPHHVTGERKLKSEDAVLIDFGCTYKGYCADMTRSWWYGKKEPAEYTKIWKITKEAYKAGVKAVKIGTTGQQVDRAARDVIEAAGYGEFFTHGTGHGVGLEIHEAPYTNQQDASPLKEGNVVTVEPGIYLVDKFGVRLEDTVAVTKTGAKILTKK